MFPCRRKGCFNKKGNGRCGIYGDHGANFPFEPFDENRCPIYNISLEAWIDMNIEIYKMFPRGYVAAHIEYRRRYGKQQKFTEKAMLSMFRHDFTNYDWMHPRCPFSHEMLRDELNKRLLEMVEGNHE